MHGYGYLDFTNLFYNFDLPMLATSKYTPFTTLSIATGYFFNSELGYSFRFNGKENDSETYGDGNALDFGARIYDSRLGRWMSLDPKFKMFTDLSPFCFGANSPIWINDIDGEIIQPTTTDSKKNLSEHFGRVFNKRMAKLLSKHIEIDGKPNPIKNLQFWIASRGLSKPQKQLASFYRNAINHKEIIEVTIGASSEKTGNTTIGEIADNKGGEATLIGISEKAVASVYVSSDYDHKKDEFIVMDNTGLTIENDQNGNNVDSKANDVDLDESIAHGILGHGSAEGQYGIKNELSAIKISNIYRQLMGRKLRTGINDGHGGTRDPKTKISNNMKDIMP
jgi:RHS repeat-associated protein